MNKTFQELVKEALVNIHGTESCKTMAKMPATELTFSILKENVEREYSKYKAELPEDQYKRFIGEMFEIHKEYKSALDKSKEIEYGKVYGDYAEKIVEIKQKYGLKAK